MIGFGELILWFYSFKMSAKFLVLNSTKILALNFRVKRSSEKIIWYVLYIDLEKRLENWNQDYELRGWLHGGRDLIKNVTKDLWFYFLALIWNLLYNIWTLIFTCSNLCFSKLSEIISFQLVKQINKQAFLAFINAEKLEVKILILS